MLGWLLKVFLLLHINSLLLLFSNDAGKNSNRKVSGKVDPITILNWMTQVCPQAEEKRLSP
jgi:hypothetical protein